MEKIILADVNPYQTRVALLEDGELAEYYVERPGRERLAGNIYKGVVRNVLPGMEAAFVDIGLEKNAFLYVGDIALDSSDFEFGDGAQKLEPRLIRQVVHEGQELLVQVLKDPSGTKGARITTNITLPSRLMVMMPRMEYVGVSRRIEDEGERMRLKRIAEALRPQGVGLIIRTAAQGVSDQELADEIPYLMDWWGSLEEKEKQTTAPRELYRDTGLTARAFRDMFDRDVKRFIVNDRASADEILAMMREQGLDESEAGVPRGRIRPLRPVLHRERHQAHVPAEILAEVRRVPDDRPHGGAHGHRREHRQVRGRDEPAGNDLPHEPRGGGGDRAADTPA